MVSILDLETLLKKARKKYGDVQVCIKVKDDKFDIKEVSIYEVDGFNHLVIGVDKSDKG